MAEKDEHVYHSIKGPKVQAIAYSQAFDNAGYYSTSSLKKGGNYSLGSEGQGEDYTRRTTRKRSCYIIAGIVCLAILLIAALVIGLYFGVFQKPEPSEPEATTTQRPTSQTTKTVTTVTAPTTPRPTTAVSFEVLLNLDDTFNTALDDPATPSYISLQNSLENMIDSVLKDSDLSNWFLGSTVTGFRRGSIWATIKTDFSSKTVRFSTQTQEQILDAQTVKLFIRQGLLEKPTEVANFRIMLDETIVEKLIGVGKLDLGEECSVDTDCSDKHTECSKSGLGAALCRCVSGYYDSNTDVKWGGACNQKIPYEGRPCTEGRQCATPNAICLNAQCVCDANTQFYKNSVCYTKLEIGESGCGLDSHCATDGAICQDNSCICNPSTLYYKGLTQECTPKKSNGQVCSINMQCFSNLCKDNLCSCHDYEFYDGAACQPKKHFGESCSKDLMCDTNMYCDSITGKCACLPLTYYDGTSCRDRKDYGEFCTSDGNCLPGYRCLAARCECPLESYYDGTSCITTTTTETTPTTTKSTPTTTEGGGYMSECNYVGMCRPGFICSGGRCDCPSDSFYVWTAAACIMTTTTQTTKTTSKETMTPSSTVTTTVTTVTTPVTPPPPVEATVDLLGEVTSAATYDSALNDTNSVLYKSYSDSVKEAIEDEFLSKGQVVLVKDIQFSEGSIKISFTIELVVTADLTPQTTEQVEELATTMVEKFRPILTEVIKSVQERTDAPGLLKKIDTNVTPILRPVEVTTPCKDGAKMINYAKTGMSGLCGVILQQLKDNPDNGVCYNYHALIDCISLAYLYNNHKCIGNTIQANFNGKVATALGLNPGKIMQCIPSHGYIFEPVDEIQPEVPCLDVNLMVLTAKYECSSFYGDMWLISMDYCRLSNESSTCLINKMTSRFGCKAANYNDLKNNALAMFVTYQTSFFPMQDRLHLEECEYCTSHTIEHLMMTQCSSPLKYMNLWTWDNADCTNLQMMVRCVEAHTSRWNTGSCPLPQIIQEIITDSDRFYPYFIHVPALWGEGFTQCLEGDIVTLGPPVTSDLCHNHNYIAYLYVYNCTDFERIEKGFVYDQCSENLRTVQCVQSYFEEHHNLNCYYNTTMSAVWLKSYKYNLEIVDILKMTGYPGSDCGDHYQNVAGQCQVVFFNEVEAVKDKCLPRMDKDLEMRIMGISDFVCGLYAEATRCAQREVLQSWCPLEDIEPAVRVGLFRNYTDVYLCPSQGFGSYDKEMICSNRQLETLAAKMLTTCGQYLLPLTYGYSQNCSRLRDFGQCLMSPYTSFVSLCGTQTVALTLDGIEDYLTSYKGFQISRSCFDDHPGVCPRVDSGNCTDTNYHSMQCLLDNDCGRLEKCCSNGCDMRCTTDIDGGAIIACPTYNATCTSRPVNNTCYVNGHCNGSQICCWDGCSNTCMAPEMGDVRYPEDCRKERIVAAAIDACEEHRYTAAHSCRSFSRVVDCVQKKLDNASRYGVQCKIEQTRDDVAHHLRGEIGQNRYCRVYDVEIKLIDYNCQLVSGGSSAFNNYVEEISSMLAAILLDIEYEVHGIEVENENNCGPVIVGIWVYKVDTVIDLDKLIAMTIEDLNERGELQKTVESFKVLYKKSDFDLCLDPPNIGRTMVEKCLRNFTDTAYQYQSYQVCRPVSDLASCIATLFGTYCEWNKIKVHLYSDKDLILQRLRMHHNTTQIRTALERYDYSECEDRGDIYPCSDSYRLEDALETCTMDLDLSSILGASGITTEMCRHFYNISACVAQKLRGLGANCNFTDYGVNAAVYKFVREKIPQGYLLPGSHLPVLEFCAGHMSVCSPAYIYHSMENNCSVSYLFHNSNKTCRSMEVMMGFTEFLTCLRLHAFARDEVECTASRMLRVISDDPRNLEIFNKTTNVQECFGDMATDLDSVLSDKNQVCRESHSFEYFDHKCRRRDRRYNCSRDIEITDMDFVCSDHFHRSSCIKEMAYNMSFTDCSWDVGTQYQICDEKLTDPEYKNCHYRLLLKKELFHHCYYNLHAVHPALSNTEQCSQFYGSVNCMKNVYAAHSDWFGCSMGSEEKALVDTIHTFLKLDAYSHHNCSWNATQSYGDRFHQCTDPPTGDICADDRAALSALVLSSCAENVTSMMDSALNNSIYYVIQDNMVKMCSFYNHLVMCGVNTTHKLYNKCSRDQVDSALQQNIQQLSQIFPVITTSSEINMCQSDCYIRSPEVRNCLREDVINNFGVFDPAGNSCRTREMDYYWNCVKRHSYYCNESAVTAHVMLAMMNVNWFSAECAAGFSPSSDANMCYNATDLAQAAFSPCQGYMIGINEAWMTNQTCNYTAFENLTRCVDEILALYSHSCYGTKREKTLKKAILSIARNYQDTSLPRCFYYSNSGYCPVREGRSQMTECYGQEYSLCDEDLDCEGYKKCCFDGCGYSCISQALEPAVWAVQFEFKYETWKPAYDRPNSTEAIQLMSKYQIYAILRNISEPRYMTLTATYSGRVQLKVQISSFYNPWYQLNRLVQMFSDPKQMYVNVMFLEQTYPGEASDNCSDVGKIAEAALTCADESFRDGNSTLQNWQVCRGVSRLAECIQRKLRNCSTHELMSQISNHSQALEARLETYDFGQYQTIRHIIRNFDYSFCENNYYDDQYPCYDNRLKNMAWDECRWRVDPMLKHLTNDQQRNYNVTPHDCRQFYIVSSCVLDKLRSAGAQCHYGIVQDFVYNKTRREITNGYVLPEDSNALQFCWDYIPVCSSIYLLSGYDCRRYSLYYGSCGSENFTEEFTYYLACLRLRALSHPEERQNCTVHRIVELIEKDPYNYGIINSNITDIGACLGADVINYLETSLSTPEAVCRSGEVLSHFAKDCVTMGTNRCEVDWSSVINASNVDVACTMYLRYVECIRLKMANMSFDCSTSDITDAAIPVLKLPDYLQSHCINKLKTVPDYRECDYSLINDHGLERCYSGLGNISYMGFNTDTTRTCSVYAESVRCLKNNIHCYIDGSIPTSVTTPPKLLLHMLQATEIMTSNMTCMDINAVTDFNQYFGGCMDWTAIGDLCSDKAVLRDITLLNCSAHIKDVIMRFYSTSRSTSWYSIAPCRLLDQMVMCGQKASARLGWYCSHEQVRESLTATPEIVRQETIVPYKSGIDSTECTATYPCNSLNEAARRCMNLTTVYKIGHHYDNGTGAVRCRTYNYLWHCVKSNLNNGYCGDDVIDAHLSFSFMEATNYPWSEWYCPRPSAVAPNMCDDYETLADFGSMTCWEPLSALMYGNHQYANRTDTYGGQYGNGTDMYGGQYGNSTDMNGNQYGNWTDMHRPCVQVAKSAAVQCFTKIFDTYSRYGCSAGDKNTTILKAIVLAARRKSHSVEHCFYDTKNGTCPAVDMKYRHCYGNESSTCILDNDCGDKQRCCFDGCASACTDLTNITAIKPGACPPIFMDYNHTNAYSDWCREDRGCSYDHKCCRNRRGANVCTPPAPALPSCFDSDRELCGVSMSYLAKNLQYYICSSLMEKLECYVNQLNEGRPPFYECNMTDIRNQFIGNSSLYHRNCNKWNLKVSYYSKNCSGSQVPAQFVETFKTQVLPELLKEFDYEYQKSRCRYSYMYEFTVHITTEKPMQDIYNSLYSQSHLFYNESYGFDLKEWSTDLDRCTHIPTLEYLAKQCLKTQSFYYEDYKICRPVYAVAYCIQQLISSFTSDYKYCENEDIVAAFFANDTLRQKFSSSLQSSLSTTNSTEGERKFLDDLTRYSKDKCPNGDQDIYPCDDFETKMRIYSKCRNNTLKNTVLIGSYLNNYGITADNCREFFLLTSCVYDEFSELRIQCWDIEQFVYEQLKKEFDTDKILPARYNHLSFCEADQPVCSSLFIQSARHKCPWNQGYWYRQPDCTASSDTEILKKFITCIRLFALSRNQVDCTPRAIKQLIKGNYFKLNVMPKRADIDRCLPDAAVANILPSRASVCTGGEPIALYESQCSRYNNLTSFNQTWNNQTYYNNQTWNNQNWDNTTYVSAQSHSDAPNYNNSVWPMPGPCSTTPRDVAEAGSVNLACMLYLSQMSCIHTILKNMSFTCTMDQLANSPVPDDKSPFYLPEHRSTCLATYNNPRYKECDAGLLQSPEALACSAILINITYAVLQDNRNRLCQVYQESLGCYDRFARKKELSCTVERLHQFQLNATALAEYSRRPWWECDKDPQSSPYDVCQAVLPPVGDLCTSSDRLATLVIGVCAGMKYTLPKFNATDNIDENVLVCKWLQSMVWCGTNVTNLVNNGNNCSVDQVRSAVQNRNDLVQSLSNYDVTVCQDGCYNSEAAVNECIHPYVWPWNMDSCRIYTYMWQCLNTRLQQNNGQYCSPSIIKSTIATNLPDYKRYWIHHCPDPRWKPLEICNNVTDVALLSGYRCTHYLYNMSHGDCSQKERVWECYEDVLTAFGGDCYAQEMTIMKAMVLGGQSQGYDVKDCIDDNFKHEGFCPTADTYCSSGGGVVDTGECLLDTECGVMQKCCYYSCNFTCRAALSEPARWSGKMTFKNETFMSGMEDNSSSVYNTFVHRYEALWSMMSKVFFKFELGKLRKGSVIGTYYVWHPRQPYDTLYFVMQTYFPGDNMYIDVGYPYRQEVDRPGTCPSYHGGIANICSTDMFPSCSYDVDCAKTTAKCCYTNCGGEKYGKRCIDLAGPPSAYQYTVIFRALDESRQPIQWQYEFSYDSYMARSLRERYDYIFQKIFVYYNVTSLMEDSEHYVNLVVIVSSNRTRDDLKNHIYLNKDYSIQLMDLYHGPPKKKNCSDQVNNIGYKCHEEMMYFMEENVSHKKCSAYKSLVECMGSGENCNSTQMKHFFNENIHGIGRAWLYNMTVTPGHNISYLSYLLSSFDPWQCTSGVDPMDLCYSKINMTWCSSHLDKVLSQEDLREKCVKLDKLGDCIQNYWSDSCNRAQIDAYLRRNIHSIGLAHIGYLPTTTPKDGTGPVMEPPEVRYLKNWDPYMCDIIVNRECPRVRPDYVGTCAEECGQWSAMNSTCVEGQSCCPNECGAHVCRPDMRACSNIYPLLEALKTKTSHCFYNLDTQDVCRSFWTSMDCVAEVIGGVAYKNECMSLLKQVLNIYADQPIFIRAIQEGVSMAIGNEVHPFNKNPLFCQNDSTTMCSDPELVYNIMTKNCGHEMTLLVDLNTEEDRCMAVDKLSICVKTFGDTWCSEDMRRRVIDKHLHFMLYRYKLFQSPFYGQMPSVPGAMMPLDPYLLYGFRPDKCEHVIMPPKIYSQPDSDYIYFKPGETARLLCSATGYPRPEYSWKRNGNYNFLAMFDGREGSLVFMNPDSNDEGRYQCYAQNKYGTAVSRIFYFVEAYLHNFYPSEPQVPYVNKGASLVLPCNPPASRPPANVHWGITHPNGTWTPVPLTERITQDSEGRLVFLNIKWEDVFDYACMVINPILRKSNQGPTHRIKVVERSNAQQALHTIHSTPSGIFALKGMTVTMTCIFGGNPTPTVEWSRDPPSSDIPRYTTQKYGMEIKFDNIQYEDAGTYSCTGTNYANGQSYTESRSITLRVEAPPKIAPPMSDVTVIPGDSVVFNCEADGVPAPVYFWYINGLPLIDVTDERIYWNPRFSMPKATQIQLDNITVLDRMVVQCNATNKHGYDWSEAYLNVKEYITTTTALPTTSSSCPYYQFRCRNGSCISSGYRCNGQNDCGDNSDEWYCGSTTSSPWWTTSLPCNSNEFRCGNGKCVDIWDKCDGYNHCGDYSDEVNCGYTLTTRSSTRWTETTTTTSPWWTETPRACYDNEFRCWNGKCVYSWYKCNGKKDCWDGSDEWNCGSTTTSPRTTTGSCQWWQYRCWDGRCVNNSYECRASTTKSPCYYSWQYKCWDGRCVNNSYECGATTTKSPCYYSWQYKCWDGRCVNRTEDCLRPSTTPVPTTTEWTGNVCSKQYLDQSRNDSCKEPYAKLMISKHVTNGSAEEKCRHYKAILACVKFHALVRGENCSVSALDQFAGQLNIREVNSYGMQCFDFSSFEAEFPDTVVESCSSSFVVGQILEYNCMLMDPNGLTDPLDKCRVQQSYSGCVKQILQESAQCSPGVVDSVLRREDVGLGRLTGVSPDYCDANYEDDECFTKLLSFANPQIQNCMAPLLSLSLLNNVTSVNNLSSTAQDGKKLKCSLFDQAMSCLHSSPEIASSCPVSKLMNALKSSIQLGMEMYIKTIQTQTPNVYFDPNRLQIDYSECTVQEISSWSCPDTALMTDRIIATCSFTVLYAVRAFNLQPCMMVSSLYSCAAAQTPENCPANHAENSLEQHRQVFQQESLGGFDPVACNAVEKCKEQMRAVPMLIPGARGNDSIESTCFKLGGLDMMVYTGKANDTEKCLGALSLQGDVESCLKLHLPNECHTVTRDLWEARMELYTYSGFHYHNCPDMDIDLCSAFHTRGFVKCYGTNFSYENRCEILECFRNEAPEKCQFLKEDIKRMAGEAFERYFYRITFDTC